MFREPTDHRLTASQRASPVPLASFVRLPPRLAGRPDGRLVALGGPSSPLVKQEKRIVRPSRASGQAIASRRLRERGQRRSTPARARVSREISQVWWG